MLKIPARSVNSPPSAASRIGLVSRIADTISPQSRTSLTSALPAAPGARDPPQPPPPGRAPPPPPPPPPPRARGPQPPGAHQDDPGLDDVDELGGHVGAQLQAGPAGLQRGEEEAADRSQHRVEGREH